MGKLLDLLRGALSRGQETRVIRLTDTDLERLANQWLCAEQQRYEQLLGEMLRQRSCILARKSGARQWTS